MSEEIDPVRGDNPELAATAISSAPGTTPDLEPTASSSGSTTVGYKTTPIPKVIGPYKLLRRLGEGGMGQVWLADQTAPVQREVALKLIRIGVYDLEHLQRFLSERQSLAIMDHPAIAKVFDAGATPDGQPYFVMEYVPGVPITRYCDDKRLTIRQRLELFIKVCEGVQHAHQKAIIHRDLKPPNILVTEVDGKPMPRIIDFGLAKAIGAEISQENLMTRAGDWVGTPGYMSPEQADSSADVDTRTDVYSLGVVLYVLLTGDQPFDVSRWSKQPFYEVVRELCEVDPQKPSTKIRKHDAATLANVAEKRQNQPEMLIRQVSGDLDCIVLKSLEKDRNRRYATPLELAADVDRYLHNVPVSAHPPSIGYRARKYASRHRVGVTVAGAGLVLLFGFAIAQSVELQKIRQQRDRADRISQFMSGIFKVSNPSEARGNTVTAREILDRASQQIGSNLSKDPELQSQLMQTMAQTYAGLGLYSRAQELTERALSIQRSLFGERNRKTLATESYLAQLLRAQNHLPKAEKLLQTTIESQRQVLGLNDPDTLASKDRLAYVFTNEGRHNDAETILRPTLEAERRVLGPNDPQTLGTLTELAEILTPQARYAEADKLYAELIAAQRRTLGPDHPSTLLSMSHAAENLEEEGRYAEAEKMYSDVIDAQRRILGPEHPQTLRAMSFLAVVLMKEGHYAEADKLQDQVIETKARVLGPTHASTLQSMELEALGLSREGRYAESEKMFRDVIDKAEKSNQPATVAETWYNFACAEAARGRADEAFADLNRAIEQGRISPGEISGDPELNSLHSDPRFAAIVAKAQTTSSIKQN
jgi:eukaryotic-like serine/threonine-protein kinase